MIYYKKNPFSTFGDILKRAQGDALAIAGKKDEGHKLWVDAAINLLEARLDRAIDLKQRKGFPANFVEVPAIRIRGCFFFRPSEITSTAEQYLASKLENLSGSFSKRGMKECSPFYSRLFADTVPYKKQALAEDCSEYVRRTFPAPNIALRFFCP